MPELMSRSKYRGVNLNINRVSVRADRNKKPSATHSIPLRFLSAASSLCFCSILTFSFVASPYSFFRSRLVTPSHNLLLSCGSCFSRGLTDLGTGFSVLTSSSVPQSSVVVEDDALVRLLMLMLLLLENEGIDDNESEEGLSAQTLTRDPGVDGDLGTRHHLILFLQHPSKAATMRSGGTCLTFVHS